MRTILFILQKEFLQIFRNKAMLPIIFVMPIIQLLVLSYAATFEIKNTPISLIDEDRSATSRLLVEKLEASGYFTVARQSFSARAADEDLLRGTAKMILHVPNDFERELRRAGAAPVRLVLNAEDGFAAGVIQAYALNIIAAFNQGIQVDFVGATPRQPVIAVEPAHWFNPDLNYQTYMVPGILVLLVTMIGTFLSAMNVHNLNQIQGRRY